MGFLMAVTRISNANFVKSYSSSTLLINGFNATRIDRLDDGRLITAWDSVSGANELLNVATLAPTATTPSAVTTMDTVASSALTEYPKFASTEAGRAFMVWDRDSDASGLQTGDSMASLVGGARYTLSTASAGGEGSTSVTRLANGNFLTIWSDTLATSGLSTAPDIMGRIVSGTTFQPISAEFRINTVTAGSQIGTALETLGDGRAVAVWETGSLTLSGFAPTGIKGRFIGTTGTPTGVEFSVDTISGGTYEEKSLEIMTLGNGGFAVAWEQTIGSTEEIHVQRFSATGAKVGGETIVESTGGDRNILNFFTTELANGGYAIGWRLTGGGPETHQLRQYAMNGVEIGTEVTLSTLAGSLGLQRFYDMKLMADGRVATFGFRGAAVATQVFDLGEERLLGSTGNDTLYGKYGVNDVIVGNLGNDVIFSFSGNDDIAAGAGDDRVTAGLGNDTIAGNLGIDRIDAGAGNDRISGEGGNDILSGGLGADRFVFNASVVSNVDTIADFEHAIDKFELSKAYFPSLVAGALAADAFVRTTDGLAVGLEDRIVYNTTTGAVIYDSNGSSAGGATTIAILTNKAGITAFDFVIV